MTHTPPTIPLPRMRPLEEIAAEYGLKIRPLLERARREEFDHIHIGRDRLMTDEQVVAFLATHTVKRKAATQREKDLAKTQERVTRRVPRQRQGRAAA